MSCARVLRRIVVAGSVAGLILAAAGRADAQEKGEYGPVPVRDSEKPLMKSVTEYEDLFVRRNARYPESAVGALVTSIGNALAPKPVDDYIHYRFHVLRDPDVNAFALPDGQVYVQAGLIAMLENEAQLAAVMAHEVNHTAGHHVILRYRSVRSKSVAGMVFGPFTLGLSDIFVGLSVSGYSRELEDEADSHGLSLMLEAGWDPRQMARTFELMQADPDVETPHRATAWSSHPQLPARVESARARAATLLPEGPTTALKVNGDEYREIVRPLSCAVALGLIDEDQPRTACVLARRLVAEAPANPATRFVLAESLRGLGALSEVAPAEQTTQTDKKQNVKERGRLTRAEREAALLATPEGVAEKKRNLETACDEYHRALELDGSMAEASRGLGLAEHGLGNNEAAGRALVAYLRARPDATDRPIVLKQLEQITAALKSDRETRP
ncbi:MAG TPA: M48 family metallopeptidase [Verrucomicrobiae bacterium]|nr:M48 family metallopeptidase [Verrucomicrobiae bacterium]